MTILKKKEKFIGDMLYHRRFSLGFSLDKLSAKIRRSKNAVYKWEVGINKPNAQSLYLLAKALKVKPDYFYHRNA